MTIEMDENIERGRERANIVFKALVEGNKGRTEAERIQVVVALQFVMAGICYSLTEGDAKEAARLVTNIIEGVCILLDKADDSLTGMTIH